MKLIYMLSVGVAAVGMTCLVGYASAANTAPGDLIPDSMLVAQGTAAPGGKGGGSAGEMGRADKGSMRSGSTNPGIGTDATSPEKAKPGTGMDTGPGGNIEGNADQYDHRQGGQVTGEKQMSDRMDGNDAKDSKTIEGVVLRVEDGNYFVKEKDGKEVRLHTDQTTQRIENINQGDWVEARVNDQNHALSIRPIGGNEASVGNETRHGRGN